MIVPEVGGFALGSAAATDPALVEVLVDLLREHGYADVTVGVGADSSALWAANRTAYALADLLGYTYGTPAGHDYEIVDLSDDVVSAPFPAGSVLVGSGLSRKWLDADLRIVFASNRTDDRAGYHLARATTMRTLPFLDDDYHYRLAAPGHVVLGELLAATPVHLAIVDAIVSSHGWSGGRAPRPLRTGCIIASTDVHLADRVGAIKMGLDPGVSPLAEAADRDASSDVLIDGDLGVYDDWINTPPSLLRSTQRRDTSWFWSRLVPPWLQTLDAETFPLESPLDAWVNERAAAFFARIDDDPIALDVLVGANFGLAAANDAITTYRTLFDKDALRRTESPLGFDPGSIATDEYAEIVPELDGLDALLTDAPTRAPGLRWRRVDGAVVFDYRRSLPIPYDEFVGAVDVTKTISAMNDYLGGRTVELDHDDAGRVIRQAERNLYLPQPNYVALWGGMPIDVSKIEVATHGADSCTLYWKTIASANGSAIADDGKVTFTRSTVGTAVIIVGRQQFVLPQALAFVEQHLDPTLRDRLVTHAYATFFSRTVANFEALVEGRDIRIGRGRAGSQDAYDPSAGEPLPSAALEELVDDLVNWLGALGEDTVRPGASTSARAAVIDDDGFTHVRGPSVRPIFAASTGGAS
ncbi:MAG: DUF362 domain-containing protein [Ilumatobacteraceae bacterium]